MVLIVVSLLLLTPAAGGASAAAPADPIAISLEFPAPRITTEDGTTSLSIDGCVTSAGAGRPAIPRKSLTVALPPDSVATRARVSDQEWSRLPGKYRIRWGQPPAPSGGSLPRRAQPDEKIYGSSRPYPARPVELQPTGRMRKVCLAALSVSPVRYYPDPGILEICSSMTVEVDYSSLAPDKGTDASPTTPDIAVNAGQAERWYSTAAPSETGDDADNSDYLIITTEALAEAPLPLIEYYREQGLSVQVVTTAWIYDNCAGSDSQAKIRTFLKERYLSWGIDYVLLVGSDASVPMRHCTPDLLREPRDYFDVPTDYYYSDLSGEWDLNGDGYYGERGVDDGIGGVDFYPEVMVGRIPSDDAATVTAICDKIVDYSRDPGAEWKHRALLPGAISNFENEENDAKEHWPATFGSALGERIKDEIATPSGFGSFTMYEKEGVQRAVPPVSPDPVACDLPLTQNDFLTKWNEGYGVITWWAHGNFNSATRWIWENDDGDAVPEEGELDWTDFIENTDTPSNARPAIVFAVSCLNGQPVDGNLAGALLESGAVAVVAGSNVTWYTLGWPDEGEGGNARLGYLWTRQIITEGQRAGKALRTADVEDFLYYTGISWGPAAPEAYCNLFGFNLFGDPAMRLDAEGAPTATGVTPDSVENTGTANLTVSGTNFLTGASVRLARDGHPDVSASNEVVDPLEINCRVDVDDVAYGAWDVVVTNPDGRSATLPGVLTLFNPRPDVTGITPATAQSGARVHVTNLSGSDFRSTAKVQLRMAGRDAIVATNVTRVSSTKLTCDFDLAGAESGRWDLFVDNGGGQSDTLPSAFEVTPETSPVWYLAEGSSDWGFTTYVCVLNPNPEPVTAEVTYMTADGPKTRGDLLLPSNSQTTINPLNDIGKADFSTRVECREGKTIAVDRTMLWDGPEAHSSVGVRAPAQKWYLPEGSSRWGFETWLLVQNPTDAEATCQLTYMIEGREPVTLPKTVPANSRRTFSMKDDIGEADASVEVSSSTQVIAERAMYRYGRREGHSSIGTVARSKQYYLAEGTTDWGFATWLLVQNPNNESVPVNITYNTTSGPVARGPLVMPPRSRWTINVNSELPARDFSTYLEASKPIIAERAMYWDNGTGEACHDSIGLSALYRKFYFADGQSSSGWETWTLVQNPGAADAHVSVTYLLAGGGAKTCYGTVKAGSRQTFFMGNVIPDGRAGAFVESDLPVMVERAMYYNGRGGGTDTVGGFSD